jgi:magnesium-transporting ATPase (P-type)
LLDPAFSPALTEYEVRCNLSNESVTVTVRKASEQATWGRQAGDTWLWYGTTVVNGTALPIFTTKGQDSQGHLVEPMQFTATIELQTGMTEAWFYFPVYYDGGTQTYTVHIIVNNI